MERIRLVGVSKRFLRGTGAQYLVRWGLRRAKAEADWFWALRDVELTLLASPRRIGIIGANGSGKTTLLRIISGVTKPTAGTVFVNGRVAPLLEPVAGMQPDLTGRENVFLIGIILGMRRHEVQKKFHAIVEFAGIRRFLDMPLKHYSLGMIMRLGFSIAIHVEADILLVDEAWSIGDEAFQAKSLERLEQLNKQNNRATIIIVSHDLDLVRRQTDDALWLHEGRMAAFGPSGQVIETYLKAVRSGHIPA